MNDGLSRRTSTGKVELVLADYGRWASDGSVSVHPHEPSLGSEPDRIITGGDPKWYFSKITRSKRKDKSRLPKSMLSQ